ncbi:hypothetical protein MRB53_006980 [Persea americana]|uniref:Uncharacterized protein n=1 Tax=Persea americana TaxID=3435 RepID=A0ACC2MHP3_PERAE|nr:hypothetical protein MRB53_006980 [Persea americana]
MGSTLSPSDNSSWVSPSGEFAFGFRPLEWNSKLFLLGIWFDKIPQKTLVWSVNRDNPVQEGSKVSLMDGELILRDHQGQEIWRAQTNDTVTSAAMRNDGNFVLMGTGSASRWESFTDPTDTILPSQRLGLSGMLSSRESVMNYSSGKFRLNLQSDGNLVLEEVALPSKNPYGAYWKSGTAGDGTQVVFNLTGYIYITLQNGSRSNLTQGNIVSTGDFYQRATLDYDGVFRQYVYPKNLSDSGQWGESWTAVLSVPQDICMATSVDVGGGVCGFNGYCRLDGNQTTCLCPNGYTYLDANNRYKGCKENFVPQSCATDDSVKEPLFGLDEMINTDWPLSDYEHYKPVNENQCREACLGDCLCAVAIFRDGDCWKKKLPLSNGRMNAGVGGKALIKVRRGNSTSPPGPPGSSRGKEDKGTLVLIISVILGGSGFLNFLLLAILVAIYFSYHKKVIKLTLNSEKLQSGFCSNPFIMSTATFHLLWFLLTLLPISAYTQTARTIDMGSTLSPSDNSSWVSPSGEFAFGFRPLEGNSKLFLLGIWFDKIPQKTLVWSVNRDNPVQEGSKVSLMDGELILRDNQGQEIWRAQTNGTVTSAAMRNDGNFVLMGTGSASRWESFTDPTDTILPSQRLGLSGMLSSCESETNYSSGKFRLNLQSDGNLVLEEVALPSKNPYGAYWKSGTAGDGTQVVFNLTGYIYITLQNGSRSNLTQGNIVSTGDFYQRATLDYDGVFRQYVYPKTKNLSDSGQWGESWTAVLSVPQDICMATSVDVGGGVCGFNGYCRLDENQPTCLCPNGYTYLDANNRYKGCKESFVPQSCATDDSVKEPLFVMEEMINIDWPLSDYEHYKPVNENQCREACLGDCLCAVAIFRDGDCWKKKLPLSNGRMNAGVGGKALIKVRRGNSTSPPGPPGSSRGKEDKGTLVLIISVILGSSGFLNFLLLAILLAIYFSYHKKVIKLTMNSAMIGTNLSTLSLIMVSVELGNKVVE